MIFCKKCGAEDADDAMAKRKERGHPLLCASCRAKPAKTVRTKFGVCIPWHGDFDLDDNPLDNRGRLYLEGKRLCGNRDCVEPTHIQPTPKPSTTSDIVQRLIADPKRTDADVNLFLGALQEWAEWGRNKRNGKL